jgi:acyl-CoA synthetase (AMP-forming)/AMP-acid ligase II
MGNCEVFLVDEKGNEVRPGETGELIVRGSNVMQGYWNDPETTARTYKPGQYPAERFMYSGDYFRKDEEGFLYFLGRKDSMIKSGGERISPKEIENLICEHADISEVAVIGLDDEVLGQAIKAFVVPHPGAELTEQDVLRYCKEKMQIKMVPRHIEIVESLPKTTNGKIDRKTLKAREVQKV